jgi:hypothetical protein
MAGEAARVAPSRAKKVATSSPAGVARPRRSSMPVLTIANAPKKEDALAGLARWRARWPAAAAHLAPDDVLVDAMRGRSSTWTRIRVNLKNVPAELRPPQETPDPDDDPTRAWRAATRRRREV